MTESKPIKAKLTVGVLLFHGFALMDAAGPMQFFTLLEDEMEVVTIGAMAGLVKCGGNVPMQAMVSFETCPPLDILVLPGAGPEHGNVFRDPAYLNFIVERAKTAQYVLSVCSGSAFLAASGLLDGKRATTNKSLYNWVVANFGKEFNIEWVPHARWVQDGRIWTSSGVTAGMDMAYAFAVHLYGADRLKTALEVIEYTPALDASDDPFSYLTQAE
ncbi:unnamed protein product [Aphanomyces euteiches]|uniref:DJ-1/PfpI domain-containing protein n=1 Tax=Aphanomyces euteiches TaxID=100861 RepID=A0A6G0WQA1_9STRA|nr:hypothetical protein Ae201684_012852 [Aphanomyces euteiches]KAH9097490.1 dimethyladenosine transferase [Aphanomyces euteiches]KAH9145307.1 hypothetical protein AeRB84_010801 [Aphanomyces euteiches]